MSHTHINSPYQCCIVHKKAKMLAEGLNNIKGLRVDVDTIETNNLMQQQNRMQAKAQAQLQERASALSKADTGGSSQGTIYESIFKTCCEIFELDWTRCPQLLATSLEEGDASAHGPLRLQIIESVYRLESLGLEESYRETVSMSPLEAVGGAYKSDAKWSFGVQCIAKRIHPLAVKWLEDEKAA